jgi:NHL repeat
VNTELNQPMGITVDWAGNLYIADTSNQSIRRVDASTGVITTVAGNGVASGLGDGKGTFSGDNGAATSAGLSLPYAVAFDALGNMFIPDSANDCVRRVDAVTKIITNVAGTGGLAGLGLFNFTYNYAHGSYLVVAPGAGMDYRLSPRWTVRVDGEYQYWPQFTFAPTSSAGVSVGVKHLIYR